MHRGTWHRPGRLRGGNTHFYGYTAPGYAEEFWILDVEGTRLMMAAGQSPDSPPEDVAERDAILDSIRTDGSGS